MTEVLFYHLERKPLEDVLPTLLERSVARGWRCVVQVAAERAPSLDDLLWTYAEESFLPHGLEADEGAEQPVVIVSRDSNPNGASVRFLIDGAALPQEPHAYARIVLIFDGRDEAATALARERWRETRSLGLAATYWQQNDEGRWEKRA